ncbi:hypothetical protein EYC84_000554 [Monilinia fructicola]|uniref:Glycolipid transfer protein domain-containing protein n=1 Tax=Monilinia fructicola TaxID=38448 RepID=A0A5M9JT27_MONFR|nr:hypothetical protein EYC84_000554 [Monilinia fructicola]
MPRVSSTQVTSCVSPLSFIISVLLLKSFCFPFSFSFQYIIFFSIIEFILVSIYHLLLPSSSPPPPPPTNNQSQINSFKMATVKAIPPGGTFIDTLDKSFVDFLQAAESLTTLFDVMGSVAFNPVKNDIGETPRETTCCTSRIRDSSRFWSLTSSRLRSTPPQKAWSGWFAV